jgi:hypothetical protein
MSTRITPPKSILEKVIDAIKAGKKDEAISSVEELHGSFKPLHDRYCDMISLLLDYIGQSLGEKAAYDATNYFMYGIYPPVISKMKDLSHEQLIEAVCRMHRAHYTEFHIEDDDEKTTIAITGCSSGGGRFMRDKQPPQAQKGGVTKKAWPWSFNREGFPYYCIHAYPLTKIFQESGVPIEIQWGKQFDEEGRPIDEPCKYLIYK